VRSDISVVPLNPDPRDKALPACKADNITATFEPID
jgi:hypothetical protein